MLDYRVTTPENVDFHFTLAGPGTRLAAWLIDLSVIITILIFVGTILAMGAAVFGGYVEATLAVSGLLVTTGYGIAFEYRWQGQTPGKRMLGIRVVGARGVRLDLTQVVLRNLLRVVDAGPGTGLLGGAFLLLHPEHRRLGDLVAGTLVVRERRVPAPERLRSVLGTTAGRVDKRLLPYGAARRIGRERRELLLDLALGRDALDDGTRLRLFRTVAGDLREILALPDDVLSGLSDEKLVLLVTAELFEG